MRDTNLAPLIFKFQLESKPDAKQITLRREACERIEGMRASRSALAES
jgi:hypothetical protein